ncbi:MAG: hypothetical protein ABR905_05995 [Terracidiphilus sp.]|jgi:hypothetical protein
MHRNTQLALLTVTGSVLCWWPSFIDPGLDLPWWIPLVIVALLAGLSACLSGGRWLRFLILATVGAFAAVRSGFEIWPPSDPIARSYEIIPLVEVPLAAALVSLIAGLIGRKIAMSSQKLGRVFWCVLVCCVAYGPVILALTPPLVANRVAHNDQLATERFMALKNAVERTRAVSGNSESICDGHSLKQNYSGPPFSEEDWRYVAGNYVRKDGYAFGIWIYCSEPGEYAIDAFPERQKGDGTRKFCVDGAGRIGCGMQSSSPRFECAPCTK